LGGESSAAGEETVISILVVLRAIAFETYCF
jgi:hypothetical protein